MVVLLVYVNDFCYYRNCLYTTGTGVSSEKEQVNKSPSTKQYIDIVEIVLRPGLRFGLANRVGPGSGRDISAVQCSKINIHSSKCMILLECLHDQLRSRVLTDSLTLAQASYENYYFISLWTTLRCVYISIGPLRRLIYYLFVDYPPMNINWAAPTIDIFLIWTTLR